MLFRSTEAGGEQGGLAAQSVPLAAEDQLLTGEDGVGVEKEEHRGDEQDIGGGKFELEAQMEPPSLLPGFSRF